jgi:hypothetical protein
MASKRQFWYQTIGLLIVYCGNPGSWNFQRFPLAFPEAFDHECGFMLVQIDRPLFEPPTQKWAVWSAPALVSTKALWAGGCYAGLSRVLQCATIASCFLFLISSFSFRLPCWYRYRLPLDTPADLLSCSTSQLWSGLDLHRTLGPML